MSEAGVSQIELPTTPRVGPYRPLNDILLGMGNVTDVSGIPLKSDRTPIAVGIDFEYAKCPYSDSPSRYPNGQPHEKPLSQREVRRLRESYPRIRKTLLATRAAYIAMEGIEDRELHLFEGIGILTILEYLPIYLVNRAVNRVPVQGKLAQHIVVGSNSASGAVGALGAYSPLSVLKSVPTGSDALRATEEIGSLTGDFGTVCAAAPRMIVNYLDLLRSGSDSIEFGDVATETDHLVQDEELPKIRSLATIIERTNAERALLRSMDYVYTTELRAFNSRKHNIRRARQLVDRFKEEVRPLIDSSVRVSAQVNAALGRETSRPNEASDILTHNRYRLQTLIEARDMGLKV